MARGDAVTDPRLVQPALTPCGADAEEGSRILQAGDRTRTLHSLR